MNSLSLIDDILTVESVNARRRSRIYRPIRDRQNPLLEYNDEEFFRRFRMNKDGFRYVFSLVEPKLTAFPTNRNSPVPTVLQLAIAIRCYANGDFQISNGDLFGVSQPYVSKTIPRVSQAIASLAPEFVQFPSGDLVKDVQNFFLDYSNFPGVCGVVDGVHIPIQSPGGPDAELYRNRKGFFSINCQVVCDHKHKLTNVVARWPGSVHDSRIWNNSKLCREFENGEREGILLADSGYPLSRQMMVPFDYPCSNRIRGRFNRSLCRSRVFVEQTIGNWKRRFPILSKQMRCKVQTTLTVIVATAVLNNICVDLKQPVPGGNAPVGEGSCYDDDPFRPGKDFVFDGEDVREVIVSRFE